MNNTATKEGWAYLHNSRVEHYFVAGRSLCARWLCFSMDFHTTMGRPKCKACLKALEKKDVKK